MADGGVTSTRDHSPAVPTDGIDAWLDDFFASYYAARPVNATFIGIHEHDHRLPDLTENGLGDSVATMRDLLRRFPHITDGAGDAVAGSSDGAGHATPARLPWHHEADLRLARGFLRTQLWEADSPHFGRSNPCVFTGEAVFGVMSLFLTEFAPIAERVDAAAARLAGIPAFLDSAKSCIDRSPPAWTERAIRECDGALAFLRDGLPLLYHTVEGAADSAAASFTDFRQWLDTDLRARPSSEVACGEDVLDLYIREGHFLETTARDIERYAEAGLDEAEARLSAHAADFGAASPAEALSGLALLHPSVDHYYSRYGDILEQVRALAESHGLLTWPEFPIRFVPRPAWARSAAPHLYFLFYRSPAAFNRPAVHDYLVTPIDASMPEAEQERLLQATNDSVIRLNHIIHHGGLGHHIQNWHAFRSASRIGRIAAVDCASRIAMFCGGTMAEGWACYATELAAAHGALSPLEQYAEVRTRTRMCARAIVDVRLHEGRMSLADAASFYQTRAGMNAAAAHSEAVKNSMFPGAALMYLTGCDRVRELRAEVAAAEGARFSLRRFHDTFLSHGSIPVNMIAAIMTGRPLPGGLLAT